MNDFSSADAATFSLTELRVSTPTFPDDFKVSVRASGKGSNNKVFTAVSQADGVKYVLRVPRRRSDTQQWGSALWEFRQTLRAAQLGVAPTIHHAFYAKHAAGEWTSGLYLFMDKYQCNLEEAMTDDAAKRDILLQDEGRVGKALAAQIVQGLEALANDLLFVYDLKPSNIVIHVDESLSDLRARIVDFGRDFCEWDTQKNDPDARIPIITGLRSLVARQHKKEEDVDAVVKHVLFATMLVQLAATTTNNLYEDRQYHRMSDVQRAEANLFAPYARKLLDSMQGSNIALVRWVLRNDDVRGVMRHYHGRRSSGTGRTLLLARGVETFTRNTK